MGFIRILAIALATLTIAAGGASAQEKTVGKYGDWTMKCLNKDCWIEQRRVTKKDGKLVIDMSLRLRKVQGAPRVLMTVDTPDRAAISIAPAFVVDNAKTATPLSWRTCFGGVCRAAALLTPQEQAQVMKGNGLRFGYRKYRAKKATAAPVSLRGVTAGLTALAAR